jgi:hypothetical protein
MSIKLQSIFLILFSFILWILTCAVLFLVPSIDVVLWRKIAACGVAGITYGSIVWLWFRATRYLRR